MNYPLHNWIAAQTGQPIWLISNVRIEADVNNCDTCGTGLTATLRYTWNDVDERTLYLGESEVVEFLNGLDRG